MWPGPAVSSSAALDIPGLCTATNLEAVGTTQNMNGEKMLDKMSARCAALSVASGEKKYIDGACVLMTDSDGDQIFSTFDTRDLDKSQPKMDCGTHAITVSGLLAPRLRRFDFLAESGVTLRGCRSSARPTRPRA